MGKAIYIATTGNIPEGIELEDLPQEFKKYVKQFKKRKEGVRTGLI